MALSDTVGETPETLTVWMDPAGLDVGIYRDTVIAEPTSGEGAPARVAVLLNVLPCREGCATRLAFLQEPTSTAAGARLDPPVRVAALAASGAVDTSFLAPVTLTIVDGTGASGARLVGKSSAPAMRGVATFDSVRIERAGVAFRLNAAAPGLDPAGSAAFDVAPAPPERLLFTAQPSDVGAGRPIAPPVQVTVVDAYGNTVMGFADTVAVAIGTNPAGGALSGRTRVVASNGVATFSDLGVNKAGTGYTLTARASGLTGDTSVAFRVRAGPVSAGQSSVTASPSAITAGGGSSAITVTVRDENANPVSGASVVLSATGSGNTLSQPTGPTDANGVVAATLSSTVAGAKTISATADGVTVSETATVTVTAGPVSATRSTITASPGTITAVIESSTITVTARDAYGNPKSGVAVALNATGTGNTLTQPSGPTDVNGVATGTLSSGVPETKTVSATAGGVPLTQTATVTVRLAPSGAEIVLVESNGTLGQSGTTLGKEFNPRNPPLGSTIVATFFWLGSSNIITQVTDYLWTGQLVGNTYTLVEYVTRNGLSMATYVATNVRNFPYPKPDAGQELIVRAHLSQSVSAGGAAIAAYTGVNPDLALALGEHRSASGYDSQGLAHPGTISYTAGALVYGASMTSAAFVGMDPPAGFTKIGTGQVNEFQEDTEYAVSPAAGSVDPRWNWTFASSHTWLASVLALQPAAAAASPTTPTQRARGLP